MSFIAAAAIAGGAALAGAYMSSSAASDAAGAQTAASQQAIDEQRREFAQTQANNAPFLATGTAANKRLAQLLGLSSSGNYADWKAANPGQWNASMDRALKAGGITNYVDPNSAQGQQLMQSVISDMQSNGVTLPSQSDPSFGSLTRNFSQSDLNADPVYQNGLQFGLDQGTGAINARALAGGNYDSGATLKALTRYGNDYGSTKANDSYNRFQTNNTNLYNRLAGVSGGGQTAANTLASTGASSADQISGLQTGMGNSNAASIVGGANAWGGGLTGAANGYQNNMILQKLLGGGSGGGFGGGSTNYFGSSPGATGDIGNYYPS